MLTTAQFGAIGFMLAGEQLCGALGVPVPQIYQQYKDKKSGIVLAIWFLGNALHNGLTSTGAFEVFYDGQLVRTAHGWLLQHAEFQGASLLQSKAMLV